MYVYHLDISMFVGDRIERGRAHFCSMLKVRVFNTLIVRSAVWPFGKFLAAEFQIKVIISKIPHIILTNKKPSLQTHRIPTRRLRRLMMVSLSEIAAFKILILVFWYSG